MTYDEIIEQLEVTKSKIKEIARNEYGGESWNDDLDALKPTCRINGARSPSKDCPKLSADQRMQSSSERSGSDAAHTWPETQGYP